MMHVSAPPYGDSSVLALRARGKLEAGKFVDDEGVSTTEPRPFRLFSNELFS